MKLMPSYVGNATRMVSRSDSAAAAGRASAARSASRKKLWISLRIVCMDVIRPSFVRWVNAYIYHKAECWEILLFLQNLNDNLSFFRK